MKLFWISITGLGLLLLPLLYAEDPTDDLKPVASEGGTLLGKVFGKAEKAKVVSESEPVISESAQVEVISDVESIPSPVVEVEMIETSAVEDEAIVESIDVTPIEIPAVTVERIEVEETADEPVSRDSGLLSRIGIGGRREADSKPAAAVEAQPEVEVIDAPKPELTDVKPIEMPAVTIEVHEDGTGSGPGLLSRVRIGGGRDPNVESASAVEAETSDPEIANVEPVEMPKVAVEAVEVEEVPEPVSSESGILARIGIGGARDSIASPERVVEVESQPEVEVAETAEPEVEDVEPVEMQEVLVAAVDEDAPQRQPGILGHIVGGGRGSKSKPDVEAEPVSEPAPEPEIEVVVDDVDTQDSAAAAEEAESPKRKMFAFNRKAVSKEETESGDEADSPVEEKSEPEVVIDPYEPGPDEEAEPELAAQEEKSEDFLAFPKASRLGHLSKSEKVIDEMIVEMLEDFQSRISQHVPPESPEEFEVDLEPVPSDFDAAWSKAGHEAIREDDRQLREDLTGSYVSALKHSNLVKVLSDGPLIRETAILEAEAEFDWRAFGVGSYTGKNEPTTTTLTTGFVGRLDEDTGELDLGIRKKIVTGAEVSLSNKLTTLESNSQFLDPNPQSSSQLVLRILQPLGRGAGYHYNLATLKIAHLDTEIAAAEQVNGLESHLLDVNRAYWGVYLARAAYLQKLALVEDTEKLVDRIEERGEIDAEATASALARAKSSLVERKTSLIRSETAVRNSEERLRVLVNDPDQPIGGGGEVIPVSRPVVTAPVGGYESTALMALARRPEVIQSIAQLRSSGLRLDLAKAERKPLLNLFAELRYSGDDAGRDLGGTFSDQFDAGAGWLVGVNYEQSLEKNAQQGRYTRRQYEFRRDVSRLHELVNDVIVDATTTYRELLTSYRTMQGRYQTVLANRAESKQLTDRLEAGEVDGSVGGQLQLILDALERSQLAEEEFLISVVAYNSALAAVERAKGTFLEIHDFELQRVPAEGSKKRGIVLEEIKVTTRE